MSYEDIKPVKYDPVVHVYPVSDQQLLSYSFNGAAYPEVKATVSNPYGSKSGMYAGVVFYNAAGRLADICRTTLSFWRYPGFISGRHRFQALRRPSG